MAAQEETKSEKALKEITIEASRVVQREDGQLIFPSESQRAASPNGYSLLAKLGLPTIRVDEVQHSISALGNQGEVVVRINGAPATRDDLLALSPQMVRSILFLDNPGLRYGSEVAYVLDIRTRRSDSGYTLGTDLTSAANSCVGDEMAFARTNWKNSEIAAAYDFSYSDLRGMRNEEVADYLFNDGTQHRIERHDASSHTRRFGHNMELKYSAADSGTYVFQATLSGELSRMPRNNSRFRVLEESNEMLCIRNSATHSFAPALDLYFFRQLRGKQSLTASTVGTLIDTDENHSNSEGSLYEYQADGHAVSLASELLYENRLRPFTLQVGLQQHVKRMRNTYQGDVEDRNVMVTRGEYAFAELKAKWRQLSFMGGLGVSDAYYHQGQHDYLFWLFRPKATVRWALPRHWSLRYTFSQTEHISRVAMMNDTRIRQNSREWTVGNPALRPNRVTNHNLQVSCNLPRLSHSLDLYFRHNARPNMMSYSRTEDNLFLGQQRNQRRIDMYYARENLSYTIVPDRLTAQCTLGLYRFRNEGDDYDHRLTSCNVEGSLQAYLGRWTLTAYADNGWKFMEGETWHKQGAATYLTCSYKLKDWTFSLYWQHPLQRNPKLEEVSLENRYIHKTTVSRGRDYGNMLSLSIAWKLQRGRAFRDVERGEGKKDRESGIM